MINTLRLDDLAPEAQKELIDFYEFLKTKYSVSKMDDRTDPRLYDKVAIDTKKLSFTRDEVHERG